MKLNLSWFKVWSLVWSRIQILSFFVDIEMSKNNIKKISETNGQKGTIWEHVEVEVEVEVESPHTGEPLLF